MGEWESGRKGERERRTDGARERGNEGARKRGSEGALRPINPLPDTRHHEYPTVHSKLQILKFKLKS